MTSPTPWTVDGFDDIRDANGKGVAYDADNLNAQLIVRAVNNHAALVDALERIKANTAYAHQTDGEAYHIHAIATRALNALETQ